MSGANIFQFRSLSDALSILRAAAAESSFTVDELVKRTKTTPGNVRFVIHRYLLKGWLVPRGSSGRPPRGYRYRWKSEEDKGSAQIQLAEGWLATTSPSPSASKQAEISKRNSDSAIEDKDTIIQWSSSKFLEGQRIAGVYDAALSKPMDSPPSSSREALDPVTEGESRQKKTLVEEIKPNSKTKVETRSNGKDEKVIYSRKPFETGE